MNRAHEWVRRINKCSAIAETADMMQIRRSEKPDTCTYHQARITSQQKSGPKYSRDVLVSECIAADGG